MSLTTATNTLIAAENPDKKDSDKSGIVNTAANKRPPADKVTETTADKFKAGSADTYKAPEVKPLLSDVNKDTDTVESRLNKLTSSGSAYLNLAKKDAMQSANTRGLINSSMAAGAGTEAGIRNAMPIAEADAKTYNETRYRNQDVQNKFLENRQSTNLNMEAAGFQSQLNKGEATHQSGLNQEEAKLLSDLEIKRDNNLSELTKEEVAQLKELEMKRDAAQGDIDKDVYGSKTDDDIRRDKIASDLNMARDEFQSSLKMGEMKLDADLKMKVEGFLNDAKFSSEAKLQILTTMNGIMRDYNNQVTEIGTSDRSAAQQATAIDLLRKNRDAELKVYEKLLGSFNDWDWGTDFTPGSTTTLAQDNNYWNAPGGQQPLTEPEVGTKIGGKTYDGNGVWSDVVYDNDYEYG